MKWLILLHQSKNNVLETSERSFLRLSKAERRSDTNSPLETLTPVAEAGSAAGRLPADGTSTTLVVLVGSGGLPLGC